MAFGARQRLLACGRGDFLGFLAFAWVGEPTFWDSWLLPEWERGLFGISGVSLGGKEDCLRFLALDDLPGGHSLDSQLLRSKRHNRQRSDRSIALSPTEYAKAALLFRDRVYWSWMERATRTRVTRSRSRLSAGKGVDRATGVFEVGGIGTTASTTITEGRVDTQCAGLLGPSEHSSNLAVGQMPDRFAVKAQLPGFLLHVHLLHRVERFPPAHSSADGSLGCTPLRPLGPVTEGSSLDSYSRRPMI